MNKNNIYDVEIGLFSGDVSGTIENVIKYFLFEIHRASNTAYDDGLENYIYTVRMIMDLLEELYKEEDMDKKIVVNENPMGSLYYEGVE